MIAVSRILIFVLIFVSFLFFLNFILWVEILTGVILALLHFLLVHIVLMWSLLLPLWICSVLLIVPLSIFPVLPLTIVDSSIYAAIVGFFTLMYYVGKLPFRVPSVVRRRLLRCYPKRWFHDQFDFRQLETSAIAYQASTITNASRLYHLLALYYLPSKMKIVTLPDPMTINSLYSDAQSRLEETLDILEALDRRVWSLMFPQTWYLRDDIQYLSDRLTLKLANLQLIIIQMEVLGVEMGPFDGDNTASENAFVAAVHKEVKKLTERREKMQGEVDSEEMSRVSQPSSSTA
jgi:hypothetical protein